MRFSTALVAAFAALAIAAPTKLVQKRQALSATTYNDISISGGKAGNALAEANAVFSALDLTDMENISEADLDFLGQVNDVANDAEVEAFNAALEDASEDEEGPIQNGKIKNKVLKLQATVLELTIKAAQGEDTADKLAAETKKLNNNIALDKAAAGEDSTFLSFDATIG